MTEEGWTSHGLKLLFDGKLQTHLREIKVLDVEGGVEAYLLGHPEIRITKIGKDFVEIDLLLVTEVGGRPLTVNKGATVREGGRITFEGNDDVIIAQKVRLRK
jgi:hypothetical protein